MLRISHKNIHITKMDPYRCAAFIEGLLAAFPDDQNVRDWAEKNIVVYLSKMEAVDKITCKLLLKVIRHIGFSKCQKA